MSFVTRLFLIVTPQITSTGQRRTSSNYSWFSSVLWFLLVRFRKSCRKMFRQMLSPSIFIIITSNSRTEGCLLIELKLWENSPIDFYTRGLIPAITQVIFRLGLDSASMMAQFHLFAMFFVFRTCHGTLQCGHEGCSESTSRYAEPYESHSVVDEIPYMISPGDFYYKFVVKHRPLVLRKTATNWPATKVRSRILFLFCHDLLTIFLVFFSTS